MKALLSVSFGTSYAHTRAKTIDVVDARLAQTFADRTFYSAWTSTRIVAKVRDERGEHHDTLEEAFARMASDGVDDVVVATMCLMQGHESSKIAQAARAWADEVPGRVARMAEPLMAGADDCRAMAGAIAEEFSALPADEALLLMGHGMGRTLKSSLTSDDPNAVYRHLQDELHALGRPRFFVATVEGTPVFEDALADIRACGATAVHLAPFMIVAGDHATNDLAGPDPDSWKSRLESQGFRVFAHLKGLGEYPAVQELVCAHARGARLLEGQR